MIQIAKITPGLLAGAVATLLATATPAAEPQTDVDSPDSDAFPIPTVAVIGRKIDAPPSQIVREVNQADFIAWNAQTMADALTYTTGVNVLVGGTSGDASPWIRGFRDRDLLVLFDGIPIGETLEGAVNLNEFSLQRVASVNVMKSAPSVIYGANGPGGVVDILPNLEGPPGHFLDGLVEAGTDGRRLLRAEGGAAGQNMNFIASFQHQESDDYSLSDDYRPELNQATGTRVNSDYDRDTLLLHFSVPDSSLGDTRVFYNLAEAESGLPPQSDDPEPDFERELLSRRQTFGFSNQFRNVPLAFKLHYNQYDSELGIYADASYGEPLEIEDAQGTGYGGKLYSTIDAWESNRLVLMAGSEWDRYEAEGVFTRGNEAETNTYTLAIEDQYWVSRRLSLAAGGIFTRFDKTALDDSQTDFNPQVSVAWRPTVRLELHGSVAERTRFPKLRELHRRRYGNPDLDEQTALNAEVGFRMYHTSGLASDFSIYHSTVDGLIERPDRQSTYLNLDDVVFKGFEAETGGWLTDKDYFRFAWSYLDAQEDQPGAESRQLRSRPKHTLTAEYRRHLSRGIELSLNSIYLKGLYDLDADDVYTEISPFFVANLKIEKSFRAYASIYVAIANLLDENYQHRLGFPREGRSVQAGLTFAL